MVDVNIRVRQTEATDPQPSLLWDTQFNQNMQTWDWMLAGNADPTNNMGLRVTRPLDTAILIQLATWRRAEAYDVLPGGNDPRGWWGDSVDLEDNETKIGSRLWLLYRSPLNADTAQRAQNYAIEALQTFIDQGAVASFNVVATYDIVKGWLMLQIDGYSQDGAKVYNQQFSRLWAAEFSSFTPAPNFSGGVELK